MDIKTCSGCGPQPIGTFGFRSGANSHLLRSKCRPCEAKYAADNRDKLVRLGRRPPPKFRWDPHIPKVEKNRFNKIKHRYGLSRASYEALFESQDGLCATCLRLLEVPFVDHDHKTGAVRGLLCKACNTALGLVEDDRDTLLRMLDYLNRQDRG